jgi:hypothetical protein
MHYRAVDPGRRQPRLADCAALALLGVLALGFRFCDRQAGVPAEPLLPKMWHEMTTESAVHHQEFSRSSPRADAENRSRRI